MGKEDNKRKFDRVGFVIDLYLSIKGKTLHYKKSNDLGMGGIFVVTDEPLPADTEGLFKIVLSPGVEGVSIKGRFKVTNVFSKDKMKGMGLNFTEVDPDSSVELYRVVKYNSDMLET